MAGEKKDKESNAGEMEVYEVHIFYLEKEESVQEFLNRLPSNIVIKEEIKKKGKSFTYEYSYKGGIFREIFVSILTRCQEKIQSIKIIRE